MEERSTQDVNKWWSQIISSEIRQLKKWLWMSEWEFLSFDSKKLDKSLEWWIYSILDDLMRFQIKVVWLEDTLNPKWDNLVDEWVENDKQNWMSYERLILETFSFELDYWHRKIYEHFVYVLHFSFSEKNSRKFQAEIYVLVLDLIDFINHLKDDEDYYSIKNQWNEDWLNSKIQIIADKALSVWLKNIFFLRSVPKIKSSKDLHFFETIRSLHKSLLMREKSLPQADILCLKITYEGYHDLSKTIHASGHQSKWYLRLQDLIHQINHIELISIRILGYISIITWINSSGMVSRMHSNQLPLDINFFTQKFNLWDKVIYGEYSCRIIDFSNKNDYGFYRYKVQKLDQPNWTLWVRQEKLRKNILTFKAKRI